MFPYQPSEQDEFLLKTYAENAHVDGLDGVPEPHLAGLQAVARTVAAKTRKDAATAASQVGGLAPDALLQVADHAAVLAVFVKPAVISGALRVEAKLVLTGLDTALQQAGYTEMNVYTGWRELPQRRLTLDIDDKANPVHPAPDY